MFSKYDDGIKLRSATADEIRTIEDVEAIVAELPIQNISMKNINVANSHPMHHIALQMWRVLCINTQPDE